MCDRPPRSKAFRTAGLVRGPRHYAVVVDAIRVDGALHRYNWTLALEADTQIAKSETLADGTLEIRSPPRKSGRFLSSRPMAPGPASVERKQPAPTACGYPLGVAQSGQQGLQLGGGVLVVLLDGQAQGVLEPRLGLVRPT